MHRTRIKVCGMKQPCQVTAAIKMGVDAIGMIFYGKSPRYVTIKQAKAIRKVVPAFVNLVGVFVNEDSENINAIANEVGLDLIQLHGDESAEDAEKLIKPYLRAIQVKNPDYVTSQIALHKKARGYLLDSYSKTKYGGTGTVFDNQSLPQELPESLIVAGGISLSTVDEILALNPYAIDVNSGIEVAPGEKDVEALQKLIALVQQHDATPSKVNTLKNQC